MNSNLDALPNVDNKQEIAKSQASKGLQISNSSQNQIYSFGNSNSLATRLWFQGNSITITYDGAFHDVAGYGTDRGVAVSWIDTRTPLDEKYYSVRYSTQSIDGPWSDEMPLWKDSTTNSKFWYKIDVAYEDQTCCEILECTANIKPRNVYYVTETTPRKYDGTTNVEFSISRNPDKTSEPNEYNNNAGFVDGEGWLSYAVEGACESKNASDAVKVVNISAKYTLNENTKESNYVFHHIVKDQTILPRSVEYEFSPIEREYDGTIKATFNKQIYEMSGDGFITGEGISVERVSGNFDGKNAGTHSIVSFDFQKSFNSETLEQNYNITAKSKDGNITPKAVTVKVTDSKSYDATVLEHVSKTGTDEVKGMVGSEAITVTFVSSDSVPGKYLYPSSENSKSSTCKVVFSAESGALEQNYKVTPTADLVITKGSLIIDITGKSNIATYNSSEQSVSGYEATSESALFDASKLHLADGKKCYASGLNAGTYNMGIYNSDWNYDHDSNLFDVKFNWEDGSLVIQKATLSINVNKDKVYDGKVLAYDASGDDIGGLQSNDRLISSHFETSSEKIGIYTTSDKDKVLQSIKFDESSGRKVSENYEIATKAILTIKDKTIPFVPPIIPGTDTTNDPVSKTINNAIASALTGDYLPMSGLVAILLFSVFLLVFASSKIFRTKTPLVETCCNAKVEKNFNKQYAADESFKIGDKSPKKQIKKPKMKKSGKFDTMSYRFGEDDDLSFTDYLGL